MPIYEYQVKDDSGCDNCREGFDHLAKISDPPLTNCPECGANIARKISAPNLAKPTPSLSESNIEKHGFTQYRRAGKGVYEKTAGKGPDLITDD